MEKSLLTRVNIEKICTISCIFLQSNLIPMPITNNRLAGIALLNHMEMKMEDRNEMKWSRCRVWFSCRCCLWFAIYLDGYLCKTEHRTELKTIFIDRIVKVNLTWLVRFAFLVKWKIYFLAIDFHWNAPNAAQIRFV